MLQEYVLQILARLKRNIDRVPYGIRWLCKATKVLVQVINHRQRVIVGYRQRIIVHVVGLCVYR